MKVLIFILIIIGIVTGAGIIYVYSGYYNIAATQPHTKITVGLINEVRDASIEYHSKGIKVPSTLDANVIREGVRHRGGANLIQALVWNVGTCRSDGKGETQSGRPTRVRVPMRGTGADQLAVVLKSL